MKKLVLLFACSTITLLSLSQDNNFNKSPISIPSPDAAQFIRYGDIPMDYSTGVPNISIPLYTVTCGKLSLPVDISYNASGIKVQDIAGTVGLGWNLNAGGLVSRTILGADDQQNRPKPFLSSSDFATAVNQCFTDANNVALLVDNVSQIFSQFKETQSDRYFFSFNGRSGIFRNDFQTGVTKTIPYSALKISTGVNNAGPYKITTEDGTNYYFEQPELTGIYYMSYYLTKIESADLTHVINIHYKQDDIVAQFVKNLQLEQTTDVSESPASYSTVVNSALRDNEFVSQTIPVMPDSITSDNETLLFQYIADRPDPRKSRLYSITILNRVTRETMKSIQFQDSYFGTAANNNQRLRLDNLYFKDATGATVQQYGFGYNNSTVLPPYYHQVGPQEHHNVDYWGYYNAADDPNLIPRELFDLPGTNLLPGEKYLYGGYRDPNPNTAQACILKEITYPTGGKTDFEYELNQVTGGYSYNNLVTDFGGLRIKTVTGTADAVSPPVVKSYKYLAASFTRIEPAIYQYNTTATRWGPASVSTMNHYGNVTGTTINSDPLIKLSTGSGPIVIYGDVIEYDGTEANNNGYVERLYNNTSIPYYIYDPTTMGNIYLDGYYLTDFGNYKPQLSAEIYYGKDQNNTIKAIKREDYTYNNFNTGTFITGVKIQRDHPFIKTGDYASLMDQDCVCIYYSDCQQRRQAIAGDFEYNNLLAVLDVPLLTEKKETVHPLNGTGSLITTTDYTYNLVTLQPIEEDVVNSKGEIFKKQSKYPIDYAASEPYATMVNRNIIDPVIEQLNFKGTNSTPFQSKRTNYNFWTGTAWSSSANNIIVPQTVETKTSPQTSYETRLRYTSYDGKGNITTLSKENDVMKTYLWGYNKTYPVAEITGVDYSTVSTYINQNILDAPPDDATFRNHLNNLRSIAGAQVNTYTYRPIVGMTSATDINGRTTYYNYDAFGRLDHIKDKDGNIVKKFCYNYLGQPGNCSIYGNTVQSGSFTKNDCSQGYSGNSVTYTVPANTYYASSQTDANNLAFNALNAKGQAYANANGTCTSTGVTVSVNSYIPYPYTVVFSNNSTNISIQLDPYGSAYPQIPPGIYNINIYPSSGSYTNTSFYVNGFSSFGAGANFFSITIGAGSYVEIGD